MFENIVAVLLPGLDFGPVQLDIVCKRILKDGGRAYVKTLPRKEVPTHVICGSPPKNRLPGVLYVKVGWFSESVKLGRLVPETAHEHAPPPPEEVRGRDREPVPWMPRREKLTRVKIESCEYIDRMIKLWKVKRDGYRLRMWVDVKNRFSRSDDGWVEVGEGVRRCLMNEITVGENY
jgi:hypothetical protein